MPVYVYQCNTCGRFEKRQSFNDAALTSCPTCGQPIKRLITPAPIVFKGSGWYSTDSRSSSFRTVDNGSQNGAEPKTDNGKTETAKTETGKTDSAATDSASSTKETAKSADA